MSTSDSANQPVPVAAAVATAPSPPTTVIVQHASPGGFLWRLFAFLGWAGFGFVTLIAVIQFFAFLSYSDTSHGITEKFHSGELFSSDKIAIIAIEGLIADGDGFVKHQIDRIREDDDVKAVVVRVDSPGGTVTGSDYMLHHLKRLREERQIPLVVSMGGIAASGGYYVSMAVGDEEKSIFAEPTTTTGSIGVMFPHYDISGLLERFNVRDDSLVTHPRKTMTSMTQPMTEEHRQLLQSYINESFDRFKEIIRQGRPAFQRNPKALDDLATGEIFSATRAKQAGLIDEIGFIEDAIARAASLAGLSADDVRVVEFERPVTLFDIAGIATASSRTRQSDFATLLDGTAPRAYYLASTAPVLMSTFTRVLEW